MYTTHIRVNLAVVIAVETDEHPQKIEKEEADKMIVDNVADTLAQWNDRDVAASIVSHRVTSMEKE